MGELVTAAQMRGCERAAIEAGEVTGLDLMERAGRRVVEAILRWRPEMAAAPGRAVVLCGPGNNGGDGFVVARLLKERGWSVTTFLYGREPAEVDSLPADAAANARRWRAMGATEPLGLGTLPREFDLCVDAIFGTGLARDLDGALEQIVAAADPERAPAFRNTVCVDLPTGLCSESGRPRPRSMRGALTVTFHRAKLGHFLGDGPECCGHLVVADIGLGREPVAGAVPVDAPPALDSLRKAKGAHKYGHGHALILAGGVGKGGAARVAARGALRIGAGLVTVGCPPAALVENARALDAVMVAPLATARVLGGLIAARRIGSVCIGPGFGHGARLRAFLAELLRNPGTAHAAPAVLLDADALSEFAEDPQALFGMLHADCVLTPHQGEFGRLFPDLLAQMTSPGSAGSAWSKLDATRAAAARAGCTVVFKGPDTVIADPSGRAAISASAYGRAAPWLATAGSGDVLAGFVTGLLARGLRPFEAARTAAWLHVECALKFGPALIAEDLPEQLPAVYRDLGI